MKIKIQKLELTNFKCFRSKEFQFGEDITTIRGRNGVGKTTIFDAILYCLFGKNSQDQTKFDIKTHDEQGNVIPHLDHSVELTLSFVEGEYERTAVLRHSVKEKWNKKRGASEEVFAGDTHEYFVNGELYTANDYKKYIDFLIDEQTFRILTNPQYFTSLKWKDQREILTRMVGSIEPEVIANTDDLVALVHLLGDSNDDIVSYRKHLGYQIKKIKEQLDKIPVRLEEQNKALPEKLDWDEIEGMMISAKNGLGRIEQRILDIKSGNGSQVKRAEITNQISATTVALDKLRIEAQSESSRAQQEKQGAINQMSIKFQEALNNQKLMEQTIEADGRLIERCEDAIKDFEAQLQLLRDAWPTQKFEVDPNAGFCPTCGQALPPDVVKGKITVMEVEFNRQKEAKKQKLNRKAALFKQCKADSESELNNSKAKLEADKTALEEIKKSINTIFAEKAKLEKESVKTADEILAENEKYAELSKQLAELKASLESVTDSDDGNDKLKEAESIKSDLEAEIAEYQSQLASKAQYEKIQKLIEGINQEQKDLVEQLSDLERKEDVARQYEDRQNEILESRVNEHFKITRWKMFRTVVNGGDSYNEPFCECYDLNGTAYHDGLNQAARLNVGLDIINAMAKVYNVSAPVIIDQSESTLDILPTVGQQLRLQVFDSDLSIV